MITKFKLLWRFADFLKVLDDEDCTIAARVGRDNPVVVKRKEDLLFEKLNEEIDELERTAR